MPFPYTIQLSKPLINNSFFQLPEENKGKSVCVENKSTMHPQWIAGFTSGDGCFKVIIKESKAYKLGSSVSIVYVLTQHVRDD